MGVKENVVTKIIKNELHNRKKQNKINGIDLLRYYFIYLYVVYFFSMYKFNHTIFLSEQSKLL